MSAGDVLMAPERTHRPAVPAAEVGTLVTRVDGGWKRERITTVPAGVPACRTWTEVDLTSGLYDTTGVVVLDAPVQP